MGFGRFFKRAFTPPRAVRQLTFRKVVSAVKPIVPFVAPILGGLPGVLGTVARFALRRPEPVPEPEPPPVIPPISFDVDPGAAIGGLPAPVYPSFEQEEDFEEEEEFEEE